MKNLDEVIKRLSNRKKYDKFLLHFILKIINHCKFFYTYSDNYTRDELLTLLISEVSTEVGYSKLMKLETFKDLN